MRKVIFQSPPSSRKKKKKKEKKTTKNGKMIFSLTWNIMFTGY